MSCWRCTWGGVSRDGWQREDSMPWMLGAPSHRRGLVGNTNKQRRKEAEWQLPPPSASCSNGRWKTASKRYRQKWIPPLCCDSTLPYYAGSQPSITKVPEHTVPSSDLLWHQAPTWHTDMHVVKTPTQKVKWINLIKKIILKSNVHSKHMRPRENTISQSLGKHSEYIKMAISDEKDTAKWGQEDWGEQETKSNEGNQRGSG